MEVIHQPPVPDPDVARQRRKWRVVLIVGIVLCCGPAVGIMVTIAGMAYTYNQIETQRAPTPNDLAVGVEWGQVATAVGMLAAVVGAVLACWAYVKLSRLRIRVETDFWK